MAAGPPAPVKYIKENHQHQIKIGIQKKKIQIKQQKENLNIWKNNGVT